MNMEIDGKKITIDGRIPRIARLAEEWFDDVENPEVLIDSLRGDGRRADILTFWQRLPDTEPKYSYCMELDSIAALPIRDFSFWWEKQINAAARNKVRKAQKRDIVVRLTDFDNELVQGITKLRSGKDGLFCTMERTLKR
jgi:hypothetical protein